MRRNKKQRNPEIVTLHGYLDLFRMTQEQLSCHITNVLRNRGRSVDRKNGYVISNGTFPVMLVCHMDTVHDKPVCDLCMSRNGRVLMSPQGIGGDDRCGVMMALEISKEFDCTLLFCEDEEIGSQGAKDFVRDRKFPDVKYIVEMDRRGNDDCVFYNCDNAEFEKFVVDSGFKTALGSFSDISVLAPAMGVAAVNISAGYFNEHTLHESVDLDIVARNIQKIKAMLRKPCDKFEYITRARTWGWEDYGTYGNRKNKWRYYDYDDWGVDVYEATTSDWLAEYNGPIIRGKSTMDANGTPFARQSGTVYLTNYEGEIFTQEAPNVAIAERGLYADGDAYADEWDDNFDAVKEYEIIDSVF